MPKSKYLSHVHPHLSLIKSWREAGLTERQISEKLNVAYSTLQEYKKLHEDLTGVLQASKEKLVANLKKSLWQEALGYEYTEVQESAEVITDEDEKNDKKTNKRPKKLRRTKITKKFRGVPNLLIFALCNLCPEEFKRIDKEAMKEIEDKIAEDRKQAQSYTDEAIRRAYNTLYEDVDRKIKKEKAAADDSSS